MRVLHRTSLLRFFALAILSLCFLTPQYALSKSSYPPNSHKENQKRNSEGQSKKSPFTNPQSKQKQGKAGKYSPSGILKSNGSSGSLEKPAIERIIFPKFDQSLMRHADKINRFNQIFKYPTKQEKVVEFRKAKKYLQALYEKNQYFLNYDKNSNPRIPKIVHQIWLGGKVPKKFVSWMSTWANMQGWEYKLWTDEEAASFPLYNRKLFDNAKNYGEKADILRYEILYSEGGLYTDVDFENVNTELFDLLNRSFDFYAGIEPIEHHQPINSPLIGNAIIGSVPGHPLLQKMIVDMSVHYSQHETEWAVVATGPVYLTQKLHEYNPAQDQNFISVILPPTFFFPMTFSEIRDSYKDNPTRFIKPETGAIHYWTGSWLEEKKEEIIPIKKPKKAAPLRQWF